jgi:hypothetical protein
MLSRTLIATGAIVLCGSCPIFADTFGSGGNAFDLDFVVIGNPGNGNDTGAGGGTLSSPFGGVGYVYRMGVTEVPQSAIAKATNLGLTNVTTVAWTGDRPAAGVTWFEAAAFVNWLNTSKGYQAAYNLGWTGSTWSMTPWSSAEAWQLDGENLFRHKDAYYFLPSEDEWYKSGYHQNDGVTANYWDFPTAGNSSPSGVTSGVAAGTAAYGTGASAPATVVASGGLSAYGTRGQGGNLIEWMESAFDGVNDQAFEDRTTRGGSFQSPVTDLQADYRVQSTYNSDPFIGLRVASIPEPSAVMLILSGGLACGFRRQKREHGSRVAA